MEGTLLLLIILFIYVDKLLLRCNFWTTVDFAQNTIQCDSSTQFILVQRLAWHLIDNRHAVSCAARRRLVLRRALNNTLAGIKYFMWASYMAAMKYQVDNTRWGTPTVDSSMFYEFVSFISSVFFNNSSNV